MHHIIIIVYTIVRAVGLFIHTVSLIYIINETDRRAAHEAYRLSSHGPRAIYIHVVNAHVYTVLRRVPRAGAANHVRLIVRRAATS